MMCSQARVRTMSGDVPHRSHCPQSPPSAACACGKQNNLPQVLGASSAGHVLCKFQGSEHVERQTSEHSPLLGVCGNKEGSQAQDGSGTTQGNHNFTGVP